MHYLMAIRQVTKAESLPDCITCTTIITTTTTATTTTVKTFSRRHRRPPLR
jgi:hypothetical protein